jgi:hypothetical protein
MICKGLLKQKLAGNVTSEDSFNPITWYYIGMTCNPKFIVVTAHSNVVLDLVRLLINVIGSVVEIGK